MPKTRYTRLIAAAAIVVLLVAGAALMLLGGARAEPGVPAAPEARLIFVGDIMVGRYVGEAMDRHGYDAPFAEVRDALSAADLAVGNLENPLVPFSSFAFPTPAPNLPSLVGSTFAVSAFSDAGFDILSLANNHILDAGPIGMQTTTEALRGTNINYTGLDLDNKQEPLIRDVRGVQVAFLGYTVIRPNVGTVYTGWTGTPGPESPLVPSLIDPASPASVERLSTEIAGANEQADVVVVMMHWGGEYTTQPDEIQKRLAEVVSRAGADLIVGAHPHVAQKMEQIGDAQRPSLVAYSLGNALFDQSSEAITREGLALEATVDASGVKSARLIPMRLDEGDRGYVMTFADDDSGQPVIERVSAESSPDLVWKGMTSSSQREPGVQVAYLRPLTRQAEEADLGIGSPAQVELREDTLRVSTQDRQGVWQMVWSTDPDWRVTGYTVGDTNADGQNELIYTVWKRALAWERPESGGMEVDQEGGPVLPHIYVEGWQRDAMNPVWHGSPRPAPVLAVAVAPIGEDRKPLLATLESGDPHKEQSPGRVRLWEWSGGFGFELASDVPGSYSQMWSDGKVLIFK